MRLLKDGYRFKCVVCGRLSSGRQPRGEGTAFYPRRHKHHDHHGIEIDCPGNIKGAVIVKVKITGNQAFEISKGS